MKHAVKREVEIEEELKAYRNRCMELEDAGRNAEQRKRALSTELESVKKEWNTLRYKLNGLEFDKFVVEEELKKYKKLWYELKEKFTRLQEDYEVVCEREKRAQERISILSDELKKMEDETRKKYVQLIGEKRDLACGKRKAEDQIETWKKRFVELESRVIQLEEESLIFTGKDPRLSMKLEAEPRGTLNTISHEDKEKEAITETKIQEANDGGDSAYLVHPKNKKLNCDAGTNVPADVGSSFFLLDKESRNVQVTEDLVVVVPPSANPLQVYQRRHTRSHPTAPTIQLSTLSEAPSLHIPFALCKGPPCIRMPPEPLVYIKEDKDSFSSEIELQDGVQVRRQLELGQKGSTNKKMDGSKPYSGRSRSGDVNEIINSDAETTEMSIVTVATSNIRDKRKSPVSVDNPLKGGLKDEKEMTSENYLNIKHSSQRRKGNESNCKGSYELSSAPKRKQLSNITSHDSGSDNDEDKISIPKLKMKRLQDLIHESTAPIVSYGNGNVEESFNPSKRHLVTQRQCEERKSELKRASLGHLGRDEPGTECQIMAGLAPENAENDQEVELVDSDTGGGESLGGFIIDGSDGEDGKDTSTDSENVGDDDLVTSMIRRNSKKNAGWTFEADMLSSFQKDPELCMKAVCALYRQQTAEKKSIQGSLYLNNLGFINIDALRGTNLAKFLMDGASRGELKKTIEELQKHMPGGLDECRRLASYHSKQLFKIYQNKEDPYFP